jgi:hypothetical protein
MPNLWIARWPNQGNPNAIDVQNIDPPAAADYPNVYGVWNMSYPTIPNPQPWKFWQYASTGFVPISSTSSLNVDMDVAHGGIEFVKDYLVPAMWTPNADGQWTTLSNWNCGIDNTVIDESNTDPALAARLPNANDRVILDRTAGNYLITLASGNQSVRSLFTNERFTMSGGSLNIAQYAQFNNTATFTGGSFAAGSVLLSAGVNLSKGAGSFTAGSFVNNGSFTQSAGTASFGSITGTGSMNVPAGLITTNSIRQNALASGGGTIRINAATGTTSVVDSLTITGSAKLDLAGQAIIVTYSGISPIAPLKNALASGYAAGAWTGNGIQSSKAASEAGSAHRTAVGYAEAADLFSVFPATFAGVSGLDNTTILIAYTASGDANLDRVVDTSDFNILASDFGGTGKRWSQGDFNYDSMVDTLDFNELASNFGYALPADTGLGTLIPEPGSLALLLTACGALSGRGRRRRAS